MKVTIWAVCGLLVFAYPLFAQVSPNPVREAEVRDNNSIRMRSIQLERVKRGAGEIPARPPTKEELAAFAEIKDDFENIQKLQNVIVKSFAGGKKIYFSKIYDSAVKINKKAIRLDANLFGGKFDNKTKNRFETTKKSVRQLIIELDAAIENFVNSPIFKESRLIDTKASEKSQSDLELIIKLSETLSAETKKLF